MPKGSGGAGSLMPSCVNRCSAVTRRELLSFKIFSFGPVFIDSLLQFGLIVCVLIFHGVPFEAAPLSMFSVLRNLPSDFLRRRVCKSLSLTAFCFSAAWPVVPSKQRKHSTRIRFRYQAANWQC